MKIHSQKPEAYNALPTWWFHHYYMETLNIPLPISCLSYLLPPFGFLGKQLFYPMWKTLFLIPFTSWILRKESFFFSFFKKVLFPGGLTYVFSYLNVNNILPTDSQRKAHKLILSQRSRAQQWSESIASGLMAIPVPVVTGPWLLGRDCYSSVLWHFMLFWHLISVI